MTLVGDPAAAAVAFVRTLRQAGLVVPVDAAATFVAALDLVDLAHPDDVYWSGRATLVRRHEDVAMFDAIFAGYFGGVPVARAAAEPPVPVTLAVDDPDGDDGDVETDGHGDDNPEIQVRFSRVETLRQKDFAAYEPDEIAEAWALIDRLRLAGAPRPSRRLVAAPRGRPDLRRTVRAALGSGGEPVERAYRRPGERLRRVVLLLDVSGSMEPYARALLRFVHAAVVARSKVEAFAVGTRLTRLTRELSRRDPDDALRRAAASVVDFAGGTRLGDGLRAFNDEWGVRGMARGAVVVILSDGWDRGDPAVLAEQMARLHRVAHQVVWVNPLKASPGYQPLTRGMAAALEHVDAFVEGHSIASLDALAAVISGRAPGLGRAEVTGGFVG